MKLGEPEVSLMYGMPSSEGTVANTSSRERTVLALRYNTTGESGVAVSVEVLRDRLTGFVGMASSSFWQDGSWRGEGQSSFADALRNGASLLKDALELEIAELEKAAEWVKVIVDDPARAVRSALQKRIVRPPSGRA